MPGTGAAMRPSETLRTGGLGSATFTHFHGGQRGSWSLSVAEPKAWPESLRARLK